MAVTRDQIIAANGFSNEFLGWGGEDDDFYRRLRSKGYNIVRLSPLVGSYKMMPHNVSNLIFMLLLSSSIGYISIRICVSFRPCLETGRRQKRCHRYASPARVAEILGGRS